MRNAVIALVVVVGILGGFYGGYKVGQNNASASASTSSNSTRTGGGAFTQGRGGLTAACPSPGATPSSGSQAFARGSISNLSSTSMTVSNTSCDVMITLSPTAATGINQRFRGAITSRCGASRPRKSATGITTVLALLIVRATNSQ